MPSWPSWSSPRPGWAADASCSETPDAAALPPRTGCRVRLSGRPATWRIVPHLVDRSCCSFESQNRPGEHPGHYDARSWPATRAVRIPGTTLLCPRRTPPGP
ncbi:AbfB domain-containing protein [Streptomyces pratens]|uniref:AbfB domain-containing protein n=1 Tax=Streptomyces pratens TaxID=887456 RepID=A0ABW1LX08_9ACTN